MNNWIGLKSEQPFDLDRTSDDEVGSWAARCNIASQENLLWSLRHTAEVPASVVAERVGVSEDELDEIMSGQVDLTMTEIRLLGIASGMVITYQTHSARREYVRWLHSASSWGGLLRGHVDEPDAVPRMSPAEFARKALRPA